MVVEFDVIAKTHLREVYEYIKKNSIQNAEKMVKEIVERAESLALYPEKYPLDKYKTNNDGTFRYFEHKRYRVSYQVLKEVILILRIRHTSRITRKY